MKTGIESKVMEQKRPINLEDKPLLTYKKGDALIKKGTPAHHALFLEKGIVKTIFENPNGKATIVHILGRGQWPGLLCALEQGYHDFDTIALTPVQARYVESSEIRQLMAHDLNQQNDFIAGTAAAVNNNIRRLIAINHKQLPGRVADVLLFFHHFFDRSATFELPLSREELAQFAGTTKESFIRTLTEFKNDKIILLEGKTVTINSMEIVTTLSRLG